MLSKALLACTAATAVLLTTHSQAALVAYWNMNEASGNIADSSGNDLTGTAAGQAGNLTYGQSTITAGTYGAITVDASTATSFGTSINFTRDATTTANSGRFDLGNPAVIEGLAEAGPTGAFTIMAWTNQVGLPSGTTYRVFSTGPTGGFGFGMANVDRIRLTTFGSVDFTSTGGTLAPNNTWHHIALTWNAGVVSMYINGNLVTSTPASSSFTDESIANYVIGANGGTTGAEAFNGRIDELKIFNTALTQSEIIAAAVPEPSVALLGGLGLLSLLRRRRE